MAAERGQTKRMAAGGMALPQTALPAAFADSLRTPVSPFALDRQRCAALSLVLMPGFALGDLARLLDVFDSANTLSKRRTFRWELVSLHGGNVHSSAGIPVAGGHSISRPSGSAFTRSAPSCVRISNL